jgi:hypothetical protein
MNSGERIDYICSLCLVINKGWSLHMDDLVVKPVELIPLNRDSFPRPLSAGEFQLIPCPRLQRPQIFLLSRKPHIADIR